MKVSSEPGIRLDDEFPDLRRSIQRYFAAETIDRGTVLFRKDSMDLFEIFLSELPSGIVQTYRCNSCRHFIERFGGLVKVGPTGKSSSVIWNWQTAPDVFGASLAAMEDRLDGLPIIEPFVSSSPVWGEPVTGSWEHFTVVPRSGLIHLSSIQTPRQRASQLTEDMRILSASVDGYSIQVVRRAVAFLESDYLRRSNMSLPIAQWLVNLIESLSDTHSSMRKKNLLWLASASAPAGWCHFKNGILGCLLDDVKAGMSFDGIKMRWDKKVDPTQYLRPQVLPKSGNIDQAEKIVEKLRSAGSLDRRFASLEDVKIRFWVPKQSLIKTHEMVFDHLRVNQSSRFTPLLQMPQKVMTWVKFKDTVLPSAEKIEYQVPEWGNFCALLTANSMDAPPIIRWDSEGCRNPVSWYLYTNKSQAYRWRLKSGMLAPVVAITPRPKYWFYESEKYDAVIFILDGAADTRDSGNALFPEILKSEYHSIRSTIENYSKTAQVFGRENASACGVAIQSGSTCNEVFHVTSRGMRAIIKIDRWD